MGNSLEKNMRNGINLYFHPDVTPDPAQAPTFKPELGFDKARKERVMIAKEEEMISAKLKPKERDYCAHLLLKFRACRKENWPFGVKCEHEKHAYLTCQYEDYVLRMKEYERERRLRVLAKSNPELESEKVAAA